MNYASMSDKELASALYASPAVTPLVRELQMRMERLIEENTELEQDVERLETALEHEQLRTVELDELRMEIAADERTCLNCGEWI